MCLSTSIDRVFMSSLEISAVNFIIDVITWQASRKYEINVHTRNRKKNQAGVLADTSIYGKVQQTMVTR